MPSVATVLNVILAVALVTDTEGAVEVAFAKVPLLTGVLWSTLANCVAPITTSWLPVQLATMLEGPAPGLVRYQISTWALPLVPEVPVARVNAAPPYDTLTPVGAPCPNARPTTRRRCSPAVELKELNVIVVALLALPDAELPYCTAAQSGVVAPRIRTAVRTANLDRPAVDTSSPRGER